MIRSLRKWKEHIRHCELSVKSTENEREQPLEKRQTDRERERERERERKGERDQRQSGSNTVDKLKLLPMSTPMFVTVTQSSR